MGDPTSKGSGPETPSTDERKNVWIDKLQSGVDQEETFRHLFNQYYRWVHTFFLRRGLSEEESDDLAQETFLRVYRSLDSFRNDSRFKTWLFQLTANVYKNALRARSSRREGSEVSLEDGAPPFGEGDLKVVGLPDGGPLDAVLIDERAALLHRALEELPPQMRRCVALRVQRDLKYREIAVLLGISVETVKAHLFQARQILKAKLGDYFAEAGFADGTQ